MNPPPILGTQVGVQQPPSLRQQGVSAQQQVERKDQRQRPSDNGGKYRADCADHPVDGAAHPVGEELDGLFDGIFPVGVLEPVEYLLGQQTVEPVQVAHALQVQGLRPAAHLNIHQPHRTHQLRHHQLAHQKEDAAHRRQGQQHIQGLDAGTQLGEALFQLQLMFKEGHGDVDHIGQHKSQDQRGGRTDADLRQAGQHRPVVDSQVQQQAAEHQAPAIFPFHLHMRIRPLLKMVRISSPPPPTPRRSGCPPAEHRSNLGWARSDRSVPNRRSSRRRHGSGCSPGIHTPSSPSSAAAGG